MRASGVVAPLEEHGGDGQRVAAALGLDPSGVLDLSASMNPVAPDPVPVLARHLDATRRYPDPRRATAALAEMLQVDGRRVLLTNGGSEAIALVAAEVRTGWVDEPDFSLYRRHLESLDPSGPRFRSNPHNPTGVLAAPDDRAGVWDEAFYPLATGRWTRGDVDRGSVVVGSLTKVLACPGLRLGYVLAPDPDLVDRLARRQPSWSVNGLGAAALPALLTPVDLPAWARSIAELRRQLVDLLERHGLRPRPAAANFVLVAGATGLRSRLAQSGVVVRDCTSFGLPDHVRVAVPDADGLHRLDAALEETDDR
ncbi:MAG: aminotransferase class I/II-fold pyridoxal phosphate-dependent enzyme [Actinobacteria bacterium]|nr:MAG: aminotransferase class I/II-fold pyridoxal phosphate-dependent enzyme [Actinomycetota bacterium]